MEQLALRNASSWSEAIFGTINLKDKRLTTRLVKIGEQLSATTGESLSKSCSGDEALVEGSYRFLRNPRVTAEQIASGGYDVTCLLAQEYETILAIEDTTSVVYKHNLSKELGYTSNKKNSKSKGYLVHSTILLDADTEKTIGLASQNRWCRSTSEYGKRASRMKRPYQEKESFKWEQNSHDIARRLGEKMHSTISVCDREADVYEYIQYKLSSKHRFIVRAMHNRRLGEGDKKLLDVVRGAKTLGTYEINIAQKGNRKQRTAAIELKVASITIPPPKRKNGEYDTLKPISLSVVCAVETNPGENEPLEWTLLTTEDVSSFKSARKVTRYYELRWRIEDFHKAWKTGAGVEKIRMQSKETLEKMMVILSFVAIRLLQLKEFFESPRQSLQQDDTKCDEILTDSEWKVLWLSYEKKELPNEVPTASWAFQAIARLGGWTDSKKTGKASWKTIWDGWAKLEQRRDGYLLALRVSEQKI